MSQTTPELIVCATERLLAEAKSVDDVSVRRIAGAAGVNVAAIGYHFGSREKLIVAAVRRVYDRLDAERMRLLQAALDAHAPEPPPLPAVIGALIGPSVRWSLDPASEYPVFVNFAALGARSKDPAIRTEMADNVTHLRAFITVLRRIAPWLSDGEIGWRLHCALGIRTNVLRYRERAAALTGGEIDLTDPSELERRMVEVIVPMFQTPFEICNRRVTRAC